jgi:uncharacterized RDD family membrane protein YckC
VSAREVRLARVRSLQGIRAGFVSRVVGLAIDMLVLGVIGFLIIFFVALVTWVVTSKGFSLQRPSGLGLLIGSAVLWIVYFDYFWTTTGRTVGEQLLGLRLVREGGGRVRGWRALARSVLTVFFAIGVLWVLVSKKNAAIQDLICGTAVVYDWSYNPPNSAAIPPT